ncbi:ATP-binding cassette domain-containing protein [Planomonospora venezuelensis]|uniref:ABC-type multidrug transport system ATPase subunit n=1 Tax=Planomonospora venezuelensis TaxID=1999 RepID=A0A841DC61_PLAVE|nr:ABC transporter ATP-binding protein [Planomonospora venezuelensis]MBB5964946.1 ABC-type multidrug transport system ATPase subunit [Planomonospora venezuelensis]GIN03301.1 ABC transporter ATP-binding protein [Planomonospora venezuelensis]
MHAAHNTAGTTGRTPVLRVDDVHTSYGRHPVLRGASLSLAAGHLGGVVGENGSGKSTLLQLLAGRLAPDRGAIRRPADFGYCPQRTILHPAFTVQQHLRFFQVAYGLRNLDRADHLMDVLGFAGHRHRQVSTLSGGTQQKLNLTLALMHDPPLLLLDEPYQGFDWETYERFWELASDLKERGSSVLIVSHLAFDLTRFDQLWRLRGGRLLDDTRAERTAANGESR